MTSRNDIEDWKDTVETTAKASTRTSKRRKTGKLTAEDHLLFLEQVEEHNDDLQKLARLGGEVWEQTKELQAITTELLNTMNLGASIPRDSIRDFTVHDWDDLIKELNYKSHPDAVHVVFIKLRNYVFLDIGRPVDKAKRSLQDALDEWFEIKPQCRALDYGGDMAAFINAKKSGTLEREHTKAKDKLAYGYRMLIHGLESFKQLEQSLNSLRDAYSGAEDLKEYYKGMTDHNQRVSWMKMKINTTLDPNDIESVVEEVYTKRWRDIRAVIGFEMVDYLRARADMLKKLHGRVVAEARQFDI